MNLLKFSVEKLNSLKTLEVCVYGTLLVLNKSGTPLWAYWDTNESQSFAARAVLNSGPVAEPIVPIRVEIVKLVGYVLDLLICWQLRALEYVFAILDQMNLLELSVVVESLNSLKTLGVSVDGTLLVLNKTGTPLWAYWDTKESQSFAAWAVLNSGLVVGKKKMWGTPLKDFGLMVAVDTLMVVRSIQMDFAVCGMIVGDLAVVDLRMLVLGDTSLLVEAGSKVMNGTQ